jgi:hypothetical protein
MPRYFVPLTLKGQLALKLKLHNRGIIDHLPENTVARLKSYRARFYDWRYHKSDRADAIIAQAKTTAER